MTVEDEASFLNGFLTRSEAIRDEAFVARQWESFCQDKKRYYLQSLNGKPGLFRRVLGKLNLLHYLDSREVHRQRLHMIRCESHREALRSILESEAKRQSRETKPKNNGV